MTTDRERANPFEEGIISATRGALASVWTALPGEIVSINRAAQTVVVQPTIQAQATDKKGTKFLINMPLLLDCPVQFPEGGGFLLTFPVEVGDECLVVFASRCIDAWWQNGGVQPQAELRMHDLSDGFAILGFRSQPNMTPNISATATELRNKAGTVKISMSDAGIAITSPTLTHNGKNIGDTHTHLNSGGPGIGGPPV